MKHNNFGYLMGEGVRAMFKHGFMSFAAVCITVACLVIVNSFLLISYNMNLMVDDLQKKMEVVVIIDETYTEAESKSVGSEINLIKNVDNARFVSRSEALEEFIGESDQSLFEGLDPENFRDQYVITLVDNEKVAETKAALERVSGVAEVQAPDEMANALATLRNVLYGATLAIAAVLLIVSLIIISNTIRLAMLDRREEIGIMKMVGATNGFIRFPFLIEGFFLGLFGAVISFFVEWGLYEATRNAIISTDLQFLTFVPFTEVLLPMVAACAIAGFAIGILGSLLSIRRFLKV